MRMWERGPIRTPTTSTSPGFATTAQDRRAWQPAPKKAPYKREEDGIVLIDQDRCEGYRHCFQGCPYKKTYYNAAKKRCQKCIFCTRGSSRSPEASIRPSHRGKTSASTSASAASAIVGYFNPNIPVMDPVNQDKNVNKLIDKWKVALRLHPEFGTEPNLFYIPPLSPPKFRVGVSFNISPSVSPSTSRKALRRQRQADSCAARRQDRADLHDPAGAGQGCIRRHIGTGRHTDGP